MIQYIGLEICYQRLFRFVNRHNHMNIMFID